MRDFCYPDPKHPGNYICPWYHGDEPHIKIDPAEYPEVMRHLAEVWDEGKQAMIDYQQGARHKVPYPVNPYRVFTQSHK